MRQLNILLISILALVAGCSTPRQAIAQETKNDIDATVNYILAIVLKATKNNDSSIAFELTSATKNAGKLKPNQQQNTGNNYAICFADATMQCLVSYHIKNPLIEQLEYTGDDGELTTKQNEKKESYISIRTNYNSKIKYVQIKNSSDSTLFTLPLKKL